MMKLRCVFLGTFAGFLLFATTSQAQQKDLLNYSIVGSSSCDTKPCYGEAIERVEVQKLLLDLAAGPRGVAFVEAALKGTIVTLDDLEKLRLVRCEGERCFLNFTLFTAEDVRRVRAVSERYAQSLADAVLARRAEIETALAAYDASGVNPKSVAFIVLGCYSLDWDGLKITAKKGYRKASDERPDGHYVPYAEEISEMSLQHVYWGSHNSTYDGASLTSFGDHFSPRYTLPDLLWRLPGRVTQGQIPDPLMQKIRGVLRQALGQTGRQAGHMMLALRDGEKSLDALARTAKMKRSEAEILLALLVELDYVAEQNGRYRAKVPVLAKRDRAMVQQLLRIGREIMDAWLAANYEKMKSELADTAPTRNGVPYGEGFTQIWHYVFGIANHYLVEAGLFANPYAPNRKFKGFIPVVFHPSVVD